MGYKKTYKEDWNKKIRHIAVKDILQKTMWREAKSYG